MKFKSVKEAREAVREVLGHDMELVCIRYDEEEEASEVVCVSEKGIYWIVKFYSDGEIGYSQMHWDLLWV